MEKIILDIPEAFSASIWEHTNANIVARKRLDGSIESIGPGKTQWYYALHVWGPSNATEDSDTRRSGLLGLDTEP